MYRLLPESSPPLLPLSCSMIRRLLAVDLLGLLPFPGDLLGVFLGVYNIQMRKRGNGYLTTKYTK